MNFVDFDLAKKLKEKGFKEKVIKYYGKHENIFDCHPPLDMNDCGYRCSAPTISQVLKWLREEKEIDIILYPIFIYNENNREREYGIEIHAPQLNKPIHLDYFKKWEKGADVGIEYVLDNLI